MLRTGHPLTQYAEILRRYELASTARLFELQDGQMTRIGGIISKLQPKTTKQGKPMAILTLEDLDGPVEVLVFPEAYARCAVHLNGVCRSRRVNRSGRLLDRAGLLLLG